MNRQKQVFLHIGFPKTGTTSIQLFLRDHSEMLKQGGIIYPEFTTHVPGPGLHTALLTALLREIPAHLSAVDPAANREELTKMLAEFERSGDRCLILSHESLSMNPHLDFDLLKEFLRPFDVTVAAWIRRLDDWLESYYDWALRSRHTAVTTPETFGPIAHMNRHTFLSSLRHWREAFPRARFSVRSYDRAGRGLLEDFADTAGLRGIPGLIPEARGYRVANAGLDKRDALFLSEISRKLEAESDRNLPFFSFLTKRFRRQEGTAELKRRIASALTKRNEAGGNHPLGDFRAGLLGNELRREARAIWNREQPGLAGEFGLDSDLLPETDIPENVTRLTNDQLFLMIKALDGKIDGTDLRHLRKTVRL
jgi:hypothetical protein